MSQKFSSVEEEQLIDLVKQYPVVFDSRHKSYKDCIAKNDAWREISTELGKDENDCKTRWKNIRDYYKKKRKECSKQSGTGSERIDDEFHKKFRHLSFLETASLVERGSVFNVKDNVAEWFNEKESISFEEVNLPESNWNVEPHADTDVVTLDVGSSMTKRMSRTAKRRLTPENPILTEIKKARNEQTTLLKAILKRSQPTEDPALSMFFQSIAATVSKFRPSLQARAKLEVMKIITNLDMENIAFLENSQPKHAEPELRSITSAD